MPLHVIPYPHIDPVLVHLGPVAIRWYALAYIAGILLGWAYARAIIRNGKLWGGKAPMTLVEFDDFLLWVTLGIILGGRTGYVLFYNLPHFIEHPQEIFELWNGGMSFHGGFTGCVIAVVVSRGFAAFRSCRWATSPARSDRSGYSSAASPISSTANCGAARPRCPGPWYSPMAARCRGIRASFMKRRWKGSCCSLCLR